MSTQSKVPLRHWATPLTIGTSVVTGVTGVLLLLKVGKSTLMAAHEWVGLLAVVAAALHIAVNWSPFKRCFTNRVGVATMIGALAVASALLLHGHPEERGGRPASPMDSMLLDVPLTLVAQLQAEDPARTVARLQAAGLTVAGTDRTGRQVAKENNRSEAQLLTVLFQGKADVKGRAQRD